MRFLTLAGAAVGVLLCAHVSLAQLPFYDDFNDGDLDGWLLWGLGETGHQVWLQDSELWAQASSVTDCDSCNECAACATVDQRVFTDFAIDVKLTNHNNCGRLQLYLRCQSPTAGTFSQLESYGHWLVSFDPGLGIWQMGARMSGAYQSPGLIHGDFPFGVGVPHYVRVVLFGNSMELWHRLEGQPDYEHIYTLNASGTLQLDGRIILVAYHSAKLASFDDVAVYSPVSPTEGSSWGRMKALYR